MAFLTIEQMKTHIYPSVRNAITNSDDTIIQDAIDSAIDLAKGYCSRYDLVLLFEGSGPSWKPSPMLLGWVKSIAKWHFINIASPNIDHEDAQIRYDQAIKGLSDIQSGKIVPAGWAPANPKERSQLWQVGSSTPKRRNHFGPNTSNPYNPNTY